MATDLFQKKTALLQGLEAEEVEDVEEAKVNPQTNQKA